MDEESASKLGLLGQFLRIPIKPIDSGRWTASCVATQ